ncbi:MAG: hypothetical protein R3E96_11075 [Planctomycetota bacterium]
MVNGYDTPGASPGGIRKRTLEVYHHVLAEAGVPWLEVRGE